MRSAAVMMTRDWAYPNDGPGDTRRAASSREPDRGYAEAMALAYRQVLPDVPDDMMALLARLN